MAAERITDSESPRILIVRLSAIGDVIQSMPIACALRERFPQAFLAWAGAGRAADLLQGHPALDELIVLARGWLKSPHAVLALRRRLREIGFDVAIDAQGLTKSAMVGWLSGAPRRLGFGDAWGRELSRWLNNELVETVGPHVIQRNLQLLGPLGVQSPAVRFDVPEHAIDRAAADVMVRQAGFERGFAIINPGAGWPSKLWPLDRYAAVARHLDRSWRLPTLVVWAGDEERAMADWIVEDAVGAARTAAPTTLPQLAALARRARLVVGSDTGPLHLAAAVGTPCVGLYGPWPAERHGPYGPQHVLVQKMVLEGSTRQRRKASLMYMEAIDVESVCQACDRVLVNRRTMGAA